MIHKLEQTYSVNFFEITLYSQFFIFTNKLISQKLLEISHNGKCEKLYTSWKYKFTIETKKLTEHKPVFQLKVAIPFNVLNI